jgi:nucleotide-binding universal stress UspA family protein
MKILVPTDGSASALKAARYAARLCQALREESSITLVSVHDDSALRYARHFVGKQAVGDYLRELSEHDLASARKALDKAGVKHDMVILTGHIAEEIARTAKRGKFDLIVLGSKGRSAIKDLLIGSVAQRVAGIAQAPVVLVK